LDLKALVSNVSSPNASTVMEIVDGPEVAPRDLRPVQFSTKKYIEDCQLENLALKETLVKVEFVGETEQHIQHLQTMLTNAQIGFTDSLERV